MFFSVARTLIVMPEFWSTNDLLMIDFANTHNWMVFAGFLITLDGCGYLSTEINIFLFKLCTTRIFDYFVVN
jgi:hypothetical protein